MNRLQKKIARYFSRLSVWLGSYGYHVLFVITLLLLSALIGWWSIFLRSSIKKEHKNSLVNLIAKSKIISLQIGNSRDNKPSSGMKFHNDRLELVKCSTIKEGFSFALKPNWPDLCIRPAARALTEIENKFKRRRFMLFGESALLVFIILICVFLLYGFIKNEKRIIRELNDFFGMVTHEIKTPITGIKAFLQTLRNQKIPPGELRPLVDMALKQIERQDNLARNLIQGQRLSRGGIGLNFETIPIVDYIKKYLEGHRLYLGESTIELEIKCSEERNVSVDIDALHAILDNIINNAVKYCGSILELNIGIEECGSEICITIADNGPGIDPEDIHRIFSPYRRLTRESSHSNTGTGMGLYISRRLALGMGGDLGAESPGLRKGSVFIIRLVKC